MRFQTPLCVFYAKGTSRLTCCVYLSLSALSVLARSRYDELYVPSKVVALDALLVRLVFLDRARRASCSASVTSLFCEALHDDKPKSITDLQSKRAHTNMVSSTFGQMVDCDWRISSGAPNQNTIPNNLPIHQAARTFLGVPVAILGECATPARGGGGATV